MEARESSGNEPNNPIPTPERPGEPKIVEEIPREIREIRTRQVEEPEEQREKTPEEPKLAETRSHSAIKKQYAVYTVHQDDLPATSAARKEQVVMVTPHIHSDLLTRSFEQYSHLQQTRNLEQGLSLFSPQYPQMGNASSQDSKRGGSNPHPGSEPASAKTGGTDSIPASAAAKEQSSGGENPSDRGMANKKEEWPTPNLNQTHSHAASSEPAGGDAPKPSAPAPTAPGGSGHSSMGSNPTLAQETEGTTSTQETIDRILKMQDSVSQQIVHSIQGSLGSSRSFISLRLNPQSLGSLSIHLKMESGKLTASLAAEKETTRALIEKNVSALRSSLDEAGIKVDRIAIVREAQEVKQTDNNKSDSNAHRFGRSKEETAHQFSRDQQQRRRQANGNEWKEQFSAQDYFL
jgi:flagellar hook-length control protein FliK